MNRKVEKFLKERGGKERMREGAREREERKREGR